MADELAGYLQHIADEGERALPRLRLFIDVRMERDLREVAEVLEDAPGVISIDLVSRQESYARYLEILGEGVADDIDKNGLPREFYVVLDHTSRKGEIEAWVGEHPEFGLVPINSSDWALQLMARAPNLFAVCEETGPSRPAATAAPNTDGP